MRRQINADDLADFYRRIGGAIWHIQYLEDSLVTFLTMKKIEEERGRQKLITVDKAQDLLKKNRQLNLGPLLEKCFKKKVIRAEHKSQFENFKEERHWLVHRSMIQNGDDLYMNLERNEIFLRIAAIGDNAIKLKEMVVEDMEAWASSRGLNIADIQRDAQAAIFKLKGIN